MAFFRRFCDVFKSTLIVLATCFIYSNSFAADTFTVTYSCGIGSGTPPVDSVNYNNNATVHVKPNSCTAPTSTLVFDGWSCNGTHYNPNDTFSISSDTTCVAQWSCPVGQHYYAPLEEHASDYWEFYPDRDNPRGLQNNDVGIVRFAVMSSSETSYDSLGGLPWYYPPNTPSASGENCWCRVTSFKRPGEEDFEQIDFLPWVFYAHNVCENESVGISYCSEISRSVTSLREALFTGGQCINNEFSIVYNGNGNSNINDVPGNKTCTYGSNNSDCIVAGQGNMLKDGYTFGGWTATCANCSNWTNTTFAPNTDLSTIITENDATITLTAIWNQCAACNTGTNCNCELSVVNNTCVYSTHAKSGYILTSGTGTSGPVCNQCVCNIPGNNHVADCNGTGTTDDNKCIFTYTCETGYAQNGTFTNSTAGVYTNETTPSCTPVVWNLRYEGNGNTSGTTPANGTTCQYNGTCTAAGQGSLLKTNNTFGGWAVTCETANHGVCTPSVSTVAAGGNLSNITAENGATITLTAIWNPCVACNAGTNCNCELSIKNNICVYNTYANSGYLVISGDKTSAPQCGACSCTKGNNVNVCNVTGTNANNQCQYEYFCNTGFYQNGTFVGNIGVTNNSSPNCSASTWTVHYEGNGNASGSVPGNQNCSYGVSCIVAGQGDLLKDGHTFGGWSATCANCSNWTNTTFASNTDLATTITENGAIITLTAIWNACEPCNPSTGCTCVMNIVNNQCVYTTGTTGNYVLASGAGTKAPQCELCNCTYNETNIDSCSVTGVNNNTCQYTYNCLNGYHVNGTTFDITGIFSADTAGVGTNVSPNCDANILYLQWKPDENADPLPNTTPQTCEYGTTGGIGGIYQPKKTGYTFTGWKTTAYSTGTIN